MTLRIAYLAPANSVCILNWATKLQTRGHQVLFLSESSRPPVLPVPFQSLKLRFRSSYLKFVFNRRLLEKTLRTFDAQIVHAYYSTNYGLLAARQRVCPAVLTVAGSDLLLEPYRNRMLDWINRFVFARMTWINPVSRQLQRELAERYRIAENSHLFPAGVDLKLFKAPEKPPDFPLRVISTRNFEPVYNHQLLSEAIPLVLQQQNHVEFWLVGEGSLRSKYENQLRPFSSVHFQGWQTQGNLAQLLAKAHVYVSTSLSDGTSASLLEAMACGLFPVVTDLPSNREWISDGENGFLVPTNDPAVLADRIMTALRDEKLRLNAREKNRRLIEAKADMAKIVEQLENLYQETIEAGREN